MKLSKMKKIYLFLLLIVSCFVLNAQTKTQADKAYSEKKYDVAVKAYEKLLSKNGESPEIYYNLGNSYYKLDNISKAILNYERALILNPGDSDIKANLDFVRSKTVDKITPVSKMFFIIWFDSLVQSVNERGWALMGIISFIILLVSVSLYLFSKRYIIKKISFICSIFLIVICIFFNVFSYIQRENVLNHEYAIVMTPSVSVKSTPNEDGTELFILHEGSKIQIKDNTMKKWKEIRLEDGNVGWIPTNAIEII